MTAHGEASADLLREASDPTTPGERLRELWVERQGQIGPCSALASNPSLPLDVFRPMLIAGHHVSTQMALAAWHNPIVPLLLQSDPAPVYREAARQLLTNMTPEGVLGTQPSLERLVEVWGRSARSFQSSSVSARQPVDLARHLASLFGLPWPEDAP